MRELISVRQVLKEIYAYVLDSDSCTPVYSISHMFRSIHQYNVCENNETCLKFAFLKNMSPRTKHIDIPYHFFRSKILNLEVEVEGVNIKDQLVDNFT